MNSPFASCFAQPRPLPLVLLLLAFAAAVPYLPFLSLPPISDDYMQIGLAREFISAEGLPRLSADALYRTRATSLFLTRLVDGLAGPDIFCHRLASVALHLVNGLLVYSLGAWPRLGYRRSLVAALVFLLLASHQEAVIWVAAVHELMVFAFVTLCLLGWLQWLRLRRVAWLMLAVSSFVCALYSKESAAVLPLMLGGLWLVEGERRPGDLVRIGVALLLVLVYAWAVFDAGARHQHLNDGTFSPHAPFVLNLLLTLGRLYLPWGALAVIYLVRRRTTAVAIAALSFSAFALLPYSFLTYMPVAPSRHNYLAALGLAVAVAYAWSEMVRSKSVRIRGLALGAAVAFILWNPLYLWLKKYPQYEWRSRPTEAFLRFARGHAQPVYVGPSPYSIWVYRYAAEIALGWEHDAVVSTGERKAPEGTAVFGFGLEP